MHPADRVCKVNDTPANRSTDMAKKKRKQAQKRKPRPQGTTPRFFLARQGFVQRVMADPVGDGVMRKCWPVANTHDDAMRLVDFFKCRADGVRPAEFGSVQGETLEGHVEMALKEGCEFVICPVRWVDDVPQWGHIDMRGRE